MIKEKKNKTRDPESRAANIGYILTILFAFLGAICFRRSVGILAMTPIAFLIWIVMAFFKTDWSLKTVITVSMTFIVNTVEQDDMKTTITFSALCLLVSIFAEVLKRGFASKKKVAKSIGFCGIAICVLLNIIFVGNPFKALSARNAILEYGENKYPESEDSALGGFDFSKIYYVFETNAYAIDVSCDRYPTENGTLTYGESHISDSFEPKMLDILAEPYVSKITSVLRETFPNDSFSVRFCEINSLPGETPLTAKENALWSDIVFEINLGGVQTANAMIERVENYSELLEKKGIDFSRIIFKSGVGSWVRRSATVSRSSSSELDKLVIERVPNGTSNRFNRYLSSLMNDK